MKLGLSLGLGPQSGGATFDPLSLSPAAWYDPSDLSTMFQDTAGATPVTADGQSVARINDKSGNGNHLTQATGIFRPTYRTNGTSRWLEFDGSNDSLAVGTIALTQPNVVYIAHKQSSAAGVMPFFETSGAIQGMYASFPGGGTMGVYAGSAVDTGISANTNSNVDGVLFNGASSTYRRNGSSTAISPGTLGLSGTFPLGTNGSSFYSGRMYQVILLDNALTAGEQASLEAYLSGKAGL